MRNCVRVARQTLTLFVWVRILVPQPWISPGIFDVPGLDFTIEVWLSLVERYVRDVEAVCSNHITSTKKGWRNRCHPYFFQYSWGFPGFLGPVFQNRPTVDVPPPKEPKNRFPNKNREAVFSFFRHRQRNDFRLSVRAVLEFDRGRRRWGSTCSRDGRND